MNEEPSAMEFEKELSAVREQMAALEASQLMLGRAAAALEASQLVLGRAEEALREGAERYGKVFEHSSDAIFIIDPERDTMIDVNPSACAVLGYSREELLSRRASEIQSNGVQGLLALAGSVSENGEGPGRRLTFMSRSGQALPSEVAASPIVIGGRPCVVVLARETTADSGATAALLGSERRFRSLIEQSSEAVLVLDTEGGIVDINQAACDGLGYTREELLAMSLADIDLEFDSAGVADAVRQTVPGLPLTVRRRDGTSMPVEVRIGTLGGGEDQLRVAMLRDVTERKRTGAALRQAEQSFRTLLDTAGEAVFVLDPGGGVVDLNQGACDSLGYTRGELLERSFSDIDAEFISAVGLKRASTDAPAELEGVHRRKDGTSFPVHVRVSEAELAGRKVRLLLARPREEGSADQRLLEERARALNDELEAFAYSVSHDLRAPLRSVEGFSQVLLDDYADQLAPEGKEHLVRVRTAAQNMARLLDGLLGLSRIARAEIHRETVDLSALARETAEELKGSGPERRVEFTIQEGAVANGDVRMLRTVMENLVGNAWKFTSKRAQATIEFGARQDEGRRVYFVRDDGVGFDGAYVGKLFGAFQRLHGATEYEGTGIGLATVQRIVARHGGRVWAEGSVDAGATFYFTLG